MCGILCLLNDKHCETTDLDNAIQEGKARGPEQTQIETIDDSTLVFHRLAINGLDAGSMQPLQLEDITMICNGEIFNYIELYYMLGASPTTNSDCEVILHLYKRLV